MIHKRIHSRYWAVIFLLAFLLMGSLGQAFGGVTPVSALDAKRLIDKHQGDADFVILDIRTPPEFQKGHISGAILVDYYHPQFKSMLDRLDRGKTYLVYCRSGNRSGRALSIFSNLGFERVYHLSKGILEWQAQRLALVPAS